MLDQLVSVIHVQSLAQVCCLLSLLTNTSLAIDDADSIIRAFHRGIKLGKEVDLLPNMTEAEKAALAQKEKKIDIPEKRQLDEDAGIPVAKKARNGVTA